MTSVSSQLQNDLQPAKRRRALLASNPPRNNRSEADRKKNHGGGETAAPPPWGTRSSPCLRKRARGLDPISGRVLPLQSMHYRCRLCRVVPGVLSGRCRRRGDPGGIAQGFPGPPLAVADESKSRPAFFETRSPGRGLCPLIAMLPAGAPVPVISAGSLGRVAPEASSCYSGAAPDQSTGLVSPAPAQAYGSSLPDLRPQRSAGKGSLCFKTP